MSATDVTAWLEGLGLGKYKELFASQEIDAGILPDLTEQDLKELGIPLGPRKKLLKAIERLSTNSNTAIEPLPTSQLAQQATTERPPPTSSTVSGSPEPSILIGDDAERRQITVMFCDLVGSTALSTQFDPEDFSEIIRLYQESCKTIIQQSQGYVARYMGDGQLIYYGYPQASEYDAVQAIRTALDIIDAVSALNPKGITLQTRVGIATGIVVIGEIIGENNAQNPAAFGQTPNLAARLQALANPDEIVIAESTRQLTSGWFDYEDLGQHTLKGFSTPIQTWRVLGALLTDSPFEARHQLDQMTPLVGREEELDLLLRRWQQAKAGEGQVVMLEGEPGIGKSHLTQALRKHLARENSRTLRYYCAPHYQNSALYPIINQMEWAAKFERNDSPATKLAKLDAALNHLPPSLNIDLPLFAALLSIPSHQHHSLLPLSPQRQKEKTLSAIESQLVALADQQPVLAVFEDIHWVDPTSLELIECAIDRIQHLPVLLILTHRPECPPMPWSGQAHVSELVLNRFNRKKIDLLLHRLTEGKTLPAEVHEQIIAKADGIPLFIEELTKTVLSTGALQNTGAQYELKSSLPSLEIPSTLQDSLMARLDKLVPVKDVIQIGAVIGRQFSYELLAAVAPLQGDGLIAALEQLVKADLLQRRGTPPNALYTFRHALLQDAAYNSLLRARRQDLHGQITQALEQLSPELITNNPELLAYHLTGAGLIEKAVTYWHLAGQRAMQRSAYNEALAHIHKGLELVAELPEDIKRNQIELTLQTALAATYQATKGFAAPETGTAYSRARALCAQIEEADKVFPVLHGVYLFHMLRSEVDTAFAVAQECLQRAERQKQQIYLCISHRLLGSCLFVKGKFISAQHHFDKTLALYDAEQQRAATADYGVDQKTIALSHLAQVMFALGSPDQALLHIEAALEHARTLNLPYNLGYVLYWANVFDLHRHEATEHVLSRAQQLMELGQQRGFPTWTAFGLFQQGAATARLGQIEHGITLMEEGMAQYLALGSEMFRPIKLAELANALAARHDYVAAISKLDNALNSKAQQQQEPWFHAELFRLKGEFLRQQSNDGATEEALGCFQQALAIAQEQGAKMWQLRAAISLAELLQQQDQPQQAYAVIEPVYQHFDQNLHAADLTKARQLIANLAA